MWILQIPIGERWQSIGESASRPPRFSLIAWGVRTKHIHGAGSLEGVILTGV